MDQALPDDLVRAAERIVDIAAPLGVRVGNVGAEVRMRQQSTGFKRLFGIDDFGQRIVVHLDGLDRVASQVGIGGDGHYHAVTDEVDPIAGEHGVSRRFQAWQ